MRLIDADALTERMKFYCKNCNSYNGVKCRACDIGEALDAIDDAPTIEPKRGKWKVILFNGTTYNTCSLCGHLEYFHDTSKYCAGCGAKMENEND